MDTPKNWFCFPSESLKLCPTALAIEQNNYNK